MLLWALSDTVRASNTGTVALQGPAGLMSLLTAVAMMMHWSCGMLQVPHMQALRFINKVAGAIHRAAPGAKVTVGVHSMPYCTTTPMPALKYGYDNAPFNYYSDAMLVCGSGDVTECHSAIGSVADVLRPGLRVR